MQPDNNLTPERIWAHLNANNAKSHFYVGFSGGLDSTVLLHLCSRLPVLSERVTAVYVNHQWHPEASDWGQHCQQQAQSLGLSYQQLIIDATPQPGQSPEETARIGRYRALAGLLSEHDALLLAQHRDDQMETFLLQCLRGAGVKGLAAMPVTAALGAGRLVRPLLELPRSALQAYARQHQLTWLEDPSNADSRYDRNFLRNQVIPVLRQRWPSLDQTVARSARHCASAEALLRDATEAAWAHCYNAEFKYLDLARLRLQSSADQMAATLRHWLAEQQHRMPETRALLALVAAIVDRRSGHGCWVVTDDYQLRSYQNRLYCLPNPLPTPETGPVPWRFLEQPLRLSVGKLSAEFGAEGIALPAWRHGEVSIRYRKGGERLKLPGRDGHRCLKKLFQEYGIPPWKRERMPLLYIGDRLAALPGIGIAAEFYASQPQAAITITWEPAY
ncbi:MAG: tRNA lysidine(34) synthetase TilS [Methylococcales bacterium]|nr:tRNA lysidine(34) synthetase TilS [Methylococcales bacterium]